MGGIGKVFKVVTFGILNAQAADAVEQIAPGLDALDRGLEEVAGVGIDVENRVGSALRLLWRGV
jgi:hypothetical protein